MDFDYFFDVKVLVYQFIPLIEWLAIYVKFLPGPRRLTIVNRKRLMLDLFHICKKAKNLIVVHVFDAVDTDNGIKFADVTHWLADIANPHLVVDLDLVNSFRLKPS